jgi:CMP-N,N'-diacetyllegionaminic acid synthase
MNIVGIIPARGGSKGIPRKNVRLLAGKPLVSWTIEAGINSNLINKVIVSTEDEEIKSISLQYGAQVIDRPPELALDETKTAPVIVHVVDELEKQGYIPDVIVLLQPTSPLRDAVLIDEVLNKFLNSEKDSIFTGFRIGEAMPIWKDNENGTVSCLYDYHLRPRRQEKHLRGNLYCEDGAFYAVKREILEQTRDFLGHNPDIYLMERLIDIDDAEQFKEVERIILSSINQ